MEPDMAGRKRGDREGRLTLTVPEAARKLGIATNTAYEAARNGQIPTIRIGDRVLVPLAALERKLQGGE
jgi:excisionase family DNA binding protein